MRLYVCPKTDDNNELITTDNLNVKNSLQHLYCHLIENGYIKNINSIKREHLLINSEGVLNKIINDDDSWKTLVPKKVVDIISSQGLFGKKPQ